MKLKRFFSILFVSCLILSGCTNNPNVTNDEKIITKRERPYAHMDKLLGEDTLLFSSTNNNKRASNVSGIGINAYLWRACLDVVSFMALSTVDPFGGVIVTEWFTPEHNMHERFKLNVVITSRTLRADGVRVHVTKQMLKNNHWTNALIDPHTEEAFETSILSRARQLYNNNATIN